MTRVQVVAVAAAAVALVAAGIGIGVGVAHTDPDTHPITTTFTDGHGRACTTYGSALDCDYPPADDRLLGWLHDNG